MTRLAVADMTFGARAATAREALAAEAAGWEPGRVRPSARLRHAVGSLLEVASDAGSDPVVAAALAEESALAGRLRGEDTDRPWRTTLGVHGFDHLTLRDRVAALAGSAPRFVAPVLAALAFRDGWDPFSPETGDACDAARDLGSILDASLDACAGKRPAGQLPERLARVAERIGDLRGDALAQLGAPWSRASIWLRMALEHRYADPCSLVEDSMLVPAMFAAGARLFRPTEDDAWTADLFDATFADLDAAERRTVLAADPLALMFALGRSHARTRAGAGWIAPWSPDWPVSHPADAA